MTFGKEVQEISLLPGPLLKNGGVSPIFLISPFCKGGLRGIYAGEGEEPLAKEGKAKYRKQI
jgi:hypothetical protein